MAQRAAEELSSSAADLAPDGEDLGGVVEVGVQPGEAGCDLRQRVARS
jgi:hypothetical protein